MKLAFHFDSMHEALGNDYAVGARGLVFSTLLAQRDSHIDSRVFTGDLLFGNVPDLKQTDVVGLWFYPQNPVWTGPSLEWSLPPHMAVYTVCFESADQKTAERLHEDLAGSASYIGAMEVGDSRIHQQLWSKLVPRFRVVGRAAQVFWGGYPEADDRDEGLFAQLQSLGFDPVSWESRAP